MLNFVILIHRPLNKELKRIEKKVFLSDSDKDRKILAHLEATSYQGNTHRKSKYTNKYLQIITLL